MVRALPRFVLALAAVLATAGCSTFSTGDKGYTAADSSITQVPASERKKPGPVSGTTLEGKRVSLSQYAGKVVVLNVWGTWCAECRAEAPTITAAARELRSDGVVFLGINNRDSSRDTGKAYQRRFDVPYPSLYDPSGETLLAFRGTLLPTSVPSTVVVDQQGRVAASILGTVPSRRTLVELVKDVAAS